MVCSQLARAYEEAGQQDEAMKAANSASILLQKSNPGLHSSFLIIIVL